MSHKRHLLPAALLTTIVLLLCIVPNALAVDTGLEGAAKGASIPVTGDIKETASRVLKAVLGFVGTLFLVLMVYAGFLYMTARGDAKKVDTAKQLIMGAIIGIVLITGAYSITSFVLEQVSGPKAAPTESAKPGTVKLGGTCTATADCADSNVCYLDQHICGIPHVSDDGRSCNEDAECKEGLVCGQTSRVCEVFQPGSVQDEGKCAQTSDCRDPLLCQNNVCKFIEWNTVPIGGDCRDYVHCEGWDDRTGPGNVCTDGKCSPPPITNLQDGEICDPDAPGGGHSQCASGLCSLSVRSFCENSSKQCNSDESCGADGPCHRSVWTCGRPSIAPHSVPEGGNCNKTEDCVDPFFCGQAGTCKAADYGACVLGKACTSNTDCSTNGGCFDNICQCDNLSP